jgi:lipopolysaccharide export system protein LptA
MTSWQRRLRLSLIVFALGLAVGLFVALRRAGPRSTVQAPVAKRDPTTVVESASGRVLKAFGAKEDLVVDYERMGQYADGHTMLMGVKAKVLQRGGRDFVVTAKEGQVQGEPPAMEVHVTGDVTITTSDGLVLRTNDASYADRDGIMHAPGPVVFSSSRMSGTAVGLTYDKTRDVLWLLDQAVIHLAPDDKGGERADVTAGAAGFARQDKYLRFDRNVRLVRGSQVITADAAVAYLTPDERHLQMIELRGSSRVTGATKGEGGLRAMRARDMNLTYAPDGQKFQRALLTGDAIVDLAGAAGGGGRRLAGEFVDLGLGADGATPTALSARDRVRMDLAADKTSPARTIRATSLESGGEAGGGLTWATFRENVEFRELPSPKAPPRVATSATLDLSLKNGFATVEAARFNGAVRFEEGAMVAVAHEGRYAIAAGTLSLAGANEKTGRGPQVIQEQAAIEGRLVVIALDAKQITAFEAVKSEMRETGQKPDGTKSTMHMPAIMQADQPVFATSDHLVSESGSSHAVYTGHAQLWQGETRIRGDTVVFDSDKGDLAGEGHVESRMILEQINDQTKQKEKVMSVGTSKTLAYEDSRRVVIYTASAHLNGPQGDLTSDKIEVYLKEDGNEVDHLEGYKSVRLKTPDGRVATGDRLTYHGADESYDMVGNPVRIVDQNACETLGKTLHFFRSTDRIIIDGHEEKRTETKGCGKGSGL